MNKLIVALCASAFAFGSVSALAGNDHEAALQDGNRGGEGGQSSSQAKWAP